MWLDKLREMKDSSKLTTREISAQSGIPEPTLEKLFAGVTKDPKLETIRQLVHFLGYTLDDLDDTPTKNGAFSPAEQDHIKKYRFLDPYGKEAVDSVLNVEWRRCTQPALRTFPQRLREAMNGMTPQAFASQLGKSYKSEVILQYLEGERMPNRSTVDYMATILQVNADWLCGLDALKHKEPAPVVEGGLDDMEQLLIQHFQGLTPDTQQSFLEHLQAMIGSQKEAPPSSAQD